MDTIAAGKFRSRHSWFGEADTVPNVCRFRKGYSWLTRPG